MSRIWLVVILIGMNALAQGAEDVTALLRQADAFRRPAGAVKVETDVEQYRKGKLDKERRYTVYVKPGRRSLILMKSPSETGQKVLMLGDQFWLMMPDSQRPLRITANQKLLGEASTGDIADMTWSEDYQGTVAGEQECPTPAADAPDVPKADKPRQCLHLDLTAARPGVTYARLDLYLEKNTRQPIKADLFVASGKRAKEAWYVKPPGERQITRMVLFDSIQSTRHTVVYYRSVTPKESPDEFFNPAALVNNALTGW
ncbi:MAG: outer membrane lipoprotein-sorting protein [Zoogloeaceae bacterium]|jgi:hypothetical protein|nr:outer membrane lipoprotein-sorting protein [Zoogloeaceae bacterium]